MASIPPLPDGTTAQAVPGAERLPHIREITPVAADDRAADTEATPVHEAAGVAEIAPSPVTDDNAAESSAPPVRAGAYCCSLYVSEEQATALRPGQPIRVKVEQG